MAPAKKKSKTEVPGSDSTVELAPLALAGNSTKHNLEQPMANEAKRFKRSEASSDISHSAANTGKQPKAMHTTASTTESGFHYLDSPFSSNNDEDLPSMPFVKPSKSLSTKTTSQQAEEYVAKVKEAADQEFDKWKQQQEVQAASKASPLAASAASNTSDNSEKFSHPIADKTPHHSSVHKSASIEEQANSALQSTKSQPQLDFTNLNSDSDHQNEANNDDQVPNKSIVSATIRSDDLSTTSDDDDEIPKATSTSSTLAATTPTQKSPANGNNTLAYKTQLFFTPKGKRFFCRLLVNNKKSPKYCMQCPYSISSSDTKLPILARGHLQNSHCLYAQDVKGNQYVQVIDTGTGSLQVTIDFTVSVTHSAFIDYLKPTQSSTLRAALINPIATSPPTLTATTTSRPSLVEENEKESFQYKCQSFFIKRGDHFYCRLVNQDGRLCNGSVVTSPNPDSTSLMMSHLKDAHHISYLDVKDKEEYVNSYDLGIRRVIIDFNEPLLEEIVSNAPAVRHQQQQATSASTTQAVTPISTRMSFAKENITMAYKWQFFFTLKNNRLFCRLLVNNKKNPKYCKQCPYSTLSNNPKLRIHARDHLRSAHNVHAPDVQGDEYVQIINTFAKNHRVTIDFTGPLPVETVQEAARAQKQRRFPMATDADSSFEIENSPSVRQQNQVTTPTLTSTYSEPEHKSKATIFDRTFTIHKPQPPNRSISADKELTIYSMFHRSLLYLVNSPEYLQTTLNEIKQVDTAFRAEAEAKFCMDPTNPELHLNLYWTHYTTYIHINKTESSHPLELLNHTFYAGMTDNFMYRQDQHLNEASRMYFAPSYQAVSTTNPNLYEHIAEGWKNENPFYMEDLSIAKKTRTSAAFHEHIVIKCLMSSSLCKNGNHGSTTPFKALLRKKNLSMDKRAKYGLAELLAFYQKLDFEDRALDVLAGSAPRSIMDCDYLNEVANRRNTSKQVKQPAPTAFSLANHAAIPNFSLVDGSEELKYIFCYSIHLFTSLFTIPSKLAFWYLWHEGSIDRLNQVDNDEHRQDYLMSISAIIIGNPTNLADCIKWARQLFTLLFDTNVRLANVQRAALNLPELYPISIDDVRGSKQIENFVIAAARLRARLYDKDENRDAPSLETVKNNLSLYLANLTEPEEVLFSDRFNETKPYHKITHFTQLADVCSLPSPEDFIKLEDPQFDPEYLRAHLSITPIEPYLDDDMAFDFIKAVYRLRFFNLKNRFTEDQHTDEGMLLRTDFPVPYFRQASLFPLFL